MVDPTSKDYKIWTTPMFSGDIEGTSDEATAVKWLANGKTVFQLQKDDDRLLNKSLFTGFSTTIA